MTSSGVIHAVREFLMRPFHKSTPRKISVDEGPIMELLELQRRNKQKISTIDRLLEEARQQLNQAAEDRRRAALPYPGSDRRKRTT